MSLFQALAQRVEGDLINGLTRETAVKETTDNDQESLDLLLALDASTSMTEVARETTDEDLDLHMTLMVD